MATPLSASIPRGALEHVQEWFASRPLVADATLGAGLVLVLGWMIGAEQGGLRVPDAWAYLFAICLGGLLLLRRRRPLLVLGMSLVLVLAYTASNYPHVGFGFALSPALYSAAERHRLRWPVTIVGSLLCFIFLAAVAASFVRETDTHLLSLFIYTMAPEIAMMAAVIALGDSVRSRRELAQRTVLVVEATSQQERVLAQAVAAAEREEIARDLHDTLGHQATVISMHTDVANEALTKDAEVVENALGVIGSTSRQMMTQLRETVHTLREHQVRPPRLCIKALEATVFRNSPLAIEADIFVAGQYDEQVETVAYRVVQEALTNTAKHSAALTVHVQIREEGENLEVQVWDHGPRRYPLAAHTSGLGILGMKERASALGGTVQSGPWGKGYRVTVLLPLAASTVEMGGAS